MVPTANPARFLLFVLISINLYVSLHAFRLPSIALPGAAPSKYQQQQKQQQKQQKQLHRYAMREEALLFSTEDVFNVGKRSGVVLTADEVSRALGKKVVSIGMPRVIAPQNSAEEFLLWFHMRDESLADNVTSLSTGRVITARSKDGVQDWVFPEDNECLGPSKEQGDWFLFDSEHVGLGDIIQPGSTTLQKFTSQGNVFLMYTFGGNADVSEINNRKIVGAKMEIGVCVSQDGMHWSRIEGPSAYGSIIEVGKDPKTDFDALFVGWPTVVEIGSKYRMYYSTYDASDKKFKIGMAEAPDGLLNWNKKGLVFAGDTRPGAQSFDSNGASRRHVLRTADGGYKMYYEAVSHDQQHSIGVAVSRDGITWERCFDEPIFTASSASASTSTSNNSGMEDSSSSDGAAWDAGGVGSPHLVYLPSRDRWRMYYVGNAVKQPGESLTANGIGFVESEDSEGFVFKR